MEANALPMPQPEGSCATLRNGASLPLAYVPEVPNTSFVNLLAGRIGGGARLSALVAVPSTPSEPPQLIAVLADDAAGQLALLRTFVEGGAFPSLTPRAPQAQAFEREIFELHGLRPEGHPWLKPLRRHSELEPGAPEHPFFTVEGEGLHEVAVGPVHAGVIEPGHFRFQCRGETVLSLEIQLGYQHRGVEHLLLSGSPARRLAVIETLAGETTMGHGSSHCLAMEALAGVEAPVRAQAIRGIALELERLANHAGDLGALCNDVGYLPGSAYYGRLRGEFLNLTLEICGNRFGRGCVVPGGARFDVLAERIPEFTSRLELALEHLLSTAEMMFDDPSVLSRFEGTGALTRAQAIELGLVGPAARACGVARDVRRDHAFGAFRGQFFPVSSAATGDVLARAQVRRWEIERSVAWILERLKALPTGATTVPLGALAPDTLAIGMSEGWRGEVVHFALTGADGALRSYKVVDPSMHNWLGLAMALRGNRISDFPLCNKSFNLSYCGHDL